MVLYLSWTVEECEHYFSSSHPPGKIISDREIKYTQALDKSTTFGSYKRYTSVNILRDNFIGYAILFD